MRLLSTESRLVRLTILVIIGCLSALAFYLVLRPLTLEYRSSAQVLVRYVTETGSSVVDPGRRNGAIWSEMEVLRSSEFSKKIIEIVGANADSALTSSVNSSHASRSA